MSNKVSILFACMDPGCDFSTRVEANAKDEAISAAFKEHDADRKNDGRGLCACNHYDTTMNGETVHY